MSNSHSAPQSAEQLFVATQGLRGLQQKGDSQRPVLLGELLHYIRGSAPVDEALIVEQLRSRLPLRRQLNQLVNELRVASAPRQALAASAEPLKVRDTRAFSLKFTPSRAHDDQVYVLLTVHLESGLNDGHKPVIVATKDAAINRLCFPVLRERSAQMLLLESDPGLALLRDNDAELSLL